MKKALFLVFILLALLGVACGGAPAAESDAIQSEIDLSQLPQDLDVQTVFDLQNNEDVYLLDVREQYEYDESHIPGINLLPMSEIEGRLGEIPMDKTVIVTCRSGNRSDQVTQFLRQNGFDNAHNMLGGILAWEDAGFPVE